MARVVALLALALIGSPAPADHPRVLLVPADRVRLRHACGLASGAEVAQTGRAGAGAGHYTALREALATADATLPGELGGAALLQFLQEREAVDTPALRVVRLGLGPASVADPLEAVLALDWCWDQLEPPLRQEFTLRLRRTAEPLRPGDSPLEPRVFRARLTALALAIIVDETDDPSPSWVDLRRRLLEAARRYFQTTFPTYVDWRGLSPTGSAAAADEELLSALTVELASHVLGRPTWPEYGATVGRWLEHYVLASVEHPALSGSFLHDDGAAAPPYPAAGWDALRPLAAHLLAARTRDPAAGLIAERVERALAARSEGDELRQRWRWVPLVLPIADVPRCDPAALPAARNLGGAVLFRGGRGPDVTRIRIDCGQPFLRRGQHFDSGHFQIERGGALVPAGDDDVQFIAVPTQRGSQHLGRQRAAFDFEQYFTATVSHNAVLFWDALQVAEWYGSRYLPTGGQRCREQICTDFATPLEDQQRITGRTLAYGQQADAAYLALDLAPAYQPAQVAQYTREFVFFWGRALVVVDRIAAGKRQTGPTWLVHLPGRPEVDGAELADAARVGGPTNEAGVWRYDSARVLRWSDRDGALWLVPVRPAPRTLRVVGGPARRLLLESGRYAGRTYVGGDADGYERLILPATARQAENAWYRLGEPLVLGSELGRIPHWGRLEIEPPARAPAALFVHVLVADRAESRSVPEVFAHPLEDGLELSLAHEQARATLRLPAGTRGGTLVLGEGDDQLLWALPGAVVQDPPLPTIDRP